MVKGNEGGIHCLSYTYAERHCVLYFIIQKALAIHKGGQPFEQDKWELYNLNADFSEVHNVTGEYPDTLKTLQDLWSQEAKKHNASLRENSLAKMAGGTTGAVNDRNSFKIFCRSGAN
ncbi:hypothetical protein [Sporomusa acidovorans]|uniref:hypothetical protein n=1 Tax=Sporomusa acidovorans TaxID=112900 RepID=UPI001160D400|nr:hypothetical protein [Sporomusa acidovorans]